MGISMSDEPAHKFSRALSNAFTITTSGQKEDIVNNMMKKALVRMSIDKILSQQSNKEPEILKVEVRTNNPYETTDNFDLRNIEYVYTDNKTIQQFISSKYDYLLRKVVNQLSEKKFIENL